MDANVKSSPLSLSKTTSDSIVEPASALQKGAKLKEYVITGIIGEGGFGIVYSAQDTVLKRNVAIKEYMPAAIANRLSSTKVNLRSVRHQQAFDAGLQGFIEEARLLAQFKHNALVEILRFWEANGTAYMVMPHYSGKTLRNLLRQDKSLCEENWLKKLLEPILDSVELLHQNNIFHRDIAPDNIVIQKNDLPVLLDLGSARRVITGMQSALTVVVKPGYAPIEQYTEDTINEQGPWTDIYALGAVLYFSITGAAPSASVSRMMRDTMKPLTSADHPHYSNEFLLAINRALALRPCDRYQTIQDFRNALALDTLHNAKPVAPQKSSLHAVAASQPDDEITQILSEAEINQFKEKLLQTISSTKTIKKDATKNINNPTPAIINTSTQITTHEKISENLLTNKQSAGTQSISSFDDVRELLESPPVIKTPEKAENTQLKANKVRQNPVDQKNTKHKKSSRKKTLLVTGGIGAVVTFSLVLLGFYFSNNEKITSQNDTVGKGNDEIDVSTQSPNEMPASDLNEGFADQQIRENELAVTNESSITVNNSLNALTESQLPEDAASTSEADLLAKELTDNQSLEKVQSLSQDKTNTDTESSDTNTVHETVAHKPITRIGKPKEQTAQLASNTQTSIEFATAKLTILPWGEIWVDNQRYGVSPPVRELSLTPGTYNLELRSSGLPSEIRTITLRKGENPVIYHNFSSPQTKPAAPEPTKKTKNQATDASKESTKTETQPSEGISDKLQENNNAKITTERNIAIKVSPWGEIYLDGKMVGITPPLHQLKLSPGAHTIEIKHPSYSSKTIHINESDPATAILEHKFQ